MGADKINPVGLIQGKNDLSRGKSKHANNQFGRVKGSLTYLGGKLPLENIVRVWATVEVKWEGESKRIQKIQQTGLGNSVKWGVAEA